MRYFVNGLTYSITTTVALIRTDRFTMEVDPKLGSSIQSGSVEVTDVRDLDRDRRLMYIKPATDRPPEGPTYTLEGRPRVGKTQVTHASLKRVAVRVLRATPRF